MCYVSWTIVKIIILEDKLCLNIFSFLFLSILDKSQQYVPTYHMYMTNVLSFFTYSMYIFEYFEPLFAFSFLGFLFIIILFLVVRCSLLIKNYYCSCHDCHNYFNVGHVYVHNLVHAQDC